MLKNAVKLNIFVQKQPFDHFKRSIDLLHALKGLVTIKATTIGEEQKFNNPFPNVYDEI